MERAQDLLLLLSMAGLSAGCLKNVDPNEFGTTFGPPPSGIGTEGDDDDDDDNDNDDDAEEESTGDEDRNEDPESSSTTSPVDPTLPPTTGPAPTTDPPEGTTTGDPETTGISASGPDPDTTSGGGYYGNPCPDYADWAYYCYFLYDGLEYCYYVIDFYYANYGATCASAVAEVFACLSEQVCLAVDCDAEITAYQNSC